MTAAPEPLALDGHELTAEIHATTSDPQEWRLVATCECLHFARQALAPSESAADYAQTLTVSEHQQHLARVASGWAVLVDPDEWLRGLA